MRANLIAVTKLLCLHYLIGKAQGNSVDTDWKVGLENITIDDWTQDIIFDHSVPNLYEGKECTVTVLQDDCLTTGDGSVFIVATNATVSRNLKSYVNMNFATIEASDYYTPLDEYRAKIAFCTRVECFYNGESVNFHETVLTLTYDFLVGFFLNPSVSPYSAYCKFKTLHSYILELYATHGDLSTESLIVLEGAAKMFLDAELNWAVKYLWNLTNPVSITATAQNQKLDTKESRRLQALLQRALYHETGSVIEMGFDGQFTYEPAPHIDDVNQAIGDIWVDGADNFLGNVSALSDFCTSVSSTIRIVHRLKHSSFSTFFLLSGTRRPEYSRSNPCQAGVRRAIHQRNVDQHKSCQRNEYNWYIGQHVI
jgi:hypothetical protein